MGKCMKRLATLLVCAAIAVVGVLMPANTSAATDFKEIKVTTLKDMDDFDSKVGKTWQIDWNLTKEKTSDVKYAKFTLAKDSIVCIYVSGSSATYVNDSFHIYGNKSMGVALFEKTFKGTAQYYTELKAGTYYISCGASYNPVWQSTDTHSTIFGIGVVPKNSAVKVTQKTNTNKNKVTIKLTEKFAYGEVSEIKYLAGKNGESANWGNATAVSTVDSSFSVTKNGWYTVRLTKDYASKDSRYGKSYIYKQIKVTGIDNKKPTVTGVKNNKKYKSAVTIKFSDNKGGSGIKKATLNGKKIKSGKKVSKKGTYTLKVYDKAGNVKTIKFKIVK